MTENIEENDEIKTIRILDNFGQFCRVHEANVKPTNRLRQKNKIFTENQPQPQHLDFDKTQARCFLIINTKDEPEKVQPEKVQPEKVKKEIRKRQIINTPLWQKMMAETSTATATTTTTTTVIASSTTALMHQQIKNKINGYKYQDVLKNKYNPVEFIDFNYTLELLKDADNKCYYCNQPVQLLYENVREPMQWSLERIDNTFGHNRGNVKIACLCCNLKRRTMYHERYLFTKKCSKKICKLLHT